MAASNQASGYGIALGAYLLWGLAPLFWKQVGSIPSADLTALRAVQTLVILLVFLAVVRQQSPRALVADRQSLRAHLLPGALLGLNWLVYVYAMATERVVEASLGYFINPLLSVVLGMVFFGERLNPVRWFAIGVAFVGVVVLAVEAGSLPWISLVLATTFAAYGVAKKRSPRGPIEGLAIEMLWIAPIAIVFLLWLALSGSFTLGEQNSPWFSWLIGAATAVPLLLFARAAQVIPLWAIGLMQYIAPTIQFLLGVVLFKETASPTRWAGFAIIWLGLFVFATNNFQSRVSSQRKVRQPRAA